MKMRNALKLVLIGLMWFPLFGTAQTTFQASKSLTLPAIEIKPLRKNSDLFEGLNLDQAARYRDSNQLIREMVKATAGGVAGGGGNEKEGDFASLARILYRHLAKDKVKSSAVLGFDIAEYEGAIDKTEPHCAVDPNVLMLMRELKKVALFTTQPFRIQLDCENYEKAKFNWDLGPIAIFHEYMRSIGRDTSAYEASSKLLMVFFDIVAVKKGLAMLLVEPTYLNRNTCQSSEQTETLAKMETCFQPRAGSDPISSASFNGTAAMLLQREFYVCLSKTYELATIDENFKVYWRDVFHLTSEYFKYDLSANRGNQKQRCGLADNLNKYIKIGNPL